MANRYWVGGAGTWSSANTANWSTTSGGAGGASVPASTDDAIFDTNSGTGTVTTAASITVNGLMLDNGNSITVSLGAAIVSATSINVRQGTLTTNNYNVTAAFFTSVSTAIRAINFGSSTVTLSSSTALNFATTETLAFNAGTSQITISNAGATFNGDGQTFYNVSFTSTAITTATINGANSFNNLTIAGRASVGVSVASITSDQNIGGTLTLSAGANATMRTFVRSNTLGTTRTLTCVVVASLTDIDFRDIAITGAAAPVSGTRLGDCKGNSGITFDAAKTVYWRATSGANWGATSSWSLTSGGTATHTAFPLAQDTAVFTATYPSTGNITLNAGYNIGSIDWSARTVSNISLSTGTVSPVIYGNWIGGTGLTNAGTGQIAFSGRGSQTISSVGIPFTQGITVDSPGGSVTLLDAFSTSRNSIGALVVTQGTFDANNYNVTLSGSAGTFISNVSTTRTVAIGSGTWTIVASSPNAWNATNATNLTITGTGTINLTSASAKTFAGGGIQTYPTINQGGAGALTITGSNKFANITNTVNGTVRFSDGSTNEFGAFNLNGTSTTTRLTLGNASGAGVQAILKKPTAWNIGTGSLDGGNNTGLSFTAGDNNFLSVSYINGQVTSPAVTYSGNFFLFF